MMKKVLSVRDHQWLRGYTDFAQMVSGYVNVETGDIVKMSEAEVSHEIAAYVISENNGETPLDSLEQGDLAALCDAFGGGNGWRAFQAGRES